MLKWVITDSWRVYRGGGLRGFFGMIKGEGWMPGTRKRGNGGRLFEGMMSVSGNKHNQHKKEAVKLTLNKYTTPDK